MNKPRFFANTDFLTFALGLIEIQARVAAGDIPDDEWNEIDSDLTKLWENLDEQERENLDYLQQVLEEIAGEEV